ncbi:MAG TPA: hypothetical protein VHI54_03725 [Actinomycetota bacterium]|nr:hypothetical protein [Actinomycetota bacterium]
MRPEAVLEASRAESETPGRRVRARRIATAVLFPLVLVAFYVVIYPARGVEVALGSDTPVYVWWARRAGALGLSAFQAGSRPGIVAPLAAMADVLRIPVAGVVSAIGPALATSLGFAVAAFVDLALGRDPFRFVLTAVFTATFLSLLVAGYFSTLAFGLLFVAALACLLTRAHALAEKDHRRAATVATVLLFAVAVMAHPQFLIFGAVVVTGSVIALIPSVQRDRRAGLPLFRTTAAWTAGTFVLGTAAGAGAVAAIGAAARAHSDTSRDAILRRLRLSSLTNESYREVLRRFFPWFRVLTVGGLAATPLFVRRNPSPESNAATDRRHLFWGAVAGWGGVTVIAVVALIVGIRSPGQRLAAFCLPLPILGALGLREVHHRLAGEERKALASRVLVLAGALWVVVAFMGWGKLQPLVSGESAAQFERAGRALAAQPKGTPLILVVHDFMEDPGIRTTRYTNYLRAVVPPARMTDVHLFWGAPRDFLSRRPTLIGRFEHDRLAEAYWNAVRRILGQRPVAVAFRGLDPQGYAQAIRLGGRELGPDVAVLPGFSGTERSEPLPSEWTDVGAGPISPWLPVWLSPVLLAALALIGWPVAAACLPQADRVIQWSLAPALGLATLGLTSWIVDTAGFRLANGGGTLAAVLAIASGLAAWLWARQAKATAVASVR